MVVGGAQGGWVVKVANHLTVGGRSSFDTGTLFLLPGRGLLGLQHADARMDAWGRGLQAESRATRMKSCDIMTPLLLKIELLKKIY